MAMRIYEGICFVDFWDGYIINVKLVYQYDNITLKLIFLFKNSFLLLFCFTYPLKAQLKQ